MVLLQLSCNSRELTTFNEMKSDEILSESFTNKELKELAKVVDFFESQICNYIQSETQTNCYVSFLKQDSIAHVNENIVQVLDYERQKELYRSIDSLVFKELWEEGESTLYRGDKEFKVKHYYLRFFHSKYLGFVEKFAKENKYIKEYIESASIQIDFASIMAPFQLIISYNNFNFNDIKTRLVYAMYYVEFNETRIQPQKRRNESLKKKE
jgi:hypothetical protein